MRKSGSERSTTFERAPRDARRYSPTRTPPSRNPRSARTRLSLNSSTSRSTSRRRRRGRRATPPRATTPPCEKFARSARSFCSPSSSPRERSARAQPRRTGFASSRLASASAKSTCSRLRRRRSPRRKPETSARMTCSGKFARSSASSSRRGTPPSSTAPSAKFSKGEVLKVEESRRIQVDRRMFPRRDAGPTPRRSPPSEPLPPWASNRAPRPWRRSAWSCSRLRRSARSR
mmetsp:Transcript_7884/g.31237  ORF Transcript_7884/g.31237 Transcript_7884/m.31237 type:complete len:232 (+) Transcript_7884:273-968(+)